MKTGNCDPTLDDTELLEFCKQGFLLLEGVVSEDVNQRTIEFVDAHPELEPTIIMDEDWFLEGVILEPEVAGAVRSLVGNQFGLPILISNHRVECPAPAQEWHTDSAAIWGPQLDYVQVFYLPQACPRELGPTELLPGSHFLYSDRDYMRQYGRIRGSYHVVAPAGSICITNYSIWHRRAESWGSGLRNNLKYSYWRTQPPKRDWIIDPDFDLATADYSLHGPTFRPAEQDSADSARMYFWLRGESIQFGLKGGQGWPIPPGHNFNDRPYGVPKDLA